MTDPYGRELLARFGWIPDAAAVAEVDAQHREARMRADLSAQWARFRAAAEARSLIAGAEMPPGREMSSRQQNRAGDPAEPVQRRTALVQEGPVLPPLTHAQIREALAFPDTPETAARSPWWPEEAA